MATAKTKQGRTTTTTVEDGDDNGQGRQQQWARTMTPVRTATARMMAMAARTTGEDGEDNR
jgi:hypothetical protein